MSTLCIIGLQWGDEGKGKIVDLFADSADFVVRYHGGANAGHTVVLNGQRFVLHQIPSGILRQGKICLLTNGMAIDPEALVEEIQGLKDRGITIKDNLYISDRAHLVMPYHKTIDILSERFSHTRLGTTQKGIGPCYADKAARRGIRLTDIYNLRYFRRYLRSILDEKNRILQSLYKAPPLSFSQVYRWAMKYAEMIRSYVADTFEIIHQALKDDKHILFEGAHGCMLDIDFGTYPYVTSSNSDIRGLYAGSGLPPQKIDRVIGVLKAYSTRVGRGPFPTELGPPLSRSLRKGGQEYGATTGRPRRCGWLDGVMSRYAIRLNGVNEIAITKLDVLSGIPRIMFCKAYKCNQDLIEFVPGDTFRLSRCEPVYQEMKGWAQDISGCRNYAGLPSAAKRYLEYIEHFLSVRITLISVGVEREQTIFK
jgi:adenylosuccinate synthase